MKKILSVVMALAMLLMTTAALAEPTKLTESASSFDVTLEIPTDATVDVSINEDSSLTSINLADATLPAPMISITPSEEYAEGSMSDLTDEELETLFQTMSADMDAPTYTLGTTSQGYKYMYIDEKGEYDSGEIVTIYQGYFIEMFFLHLDYAEISDADYQAMLAIFDTLTILPVTK